MDPGFGEECRLGAQAVGVIVNINPTGIIWRCADNLGDDSDVGAESVQIDLVSTDSIEEYVAFSFDETKQCKCQRAL